MKPAAFLTTLLLAALLLLVPTVAAQVIPARYEAVPMPSDASKQVVNIFVYKANTPANEAVALPVVYVPLVEKRDYGHLQSLERMIQQGILPPMRIVGVQRTGKLMPYGGAEPALYASFKHGETLLPTENEWFCHLLNSEVIPAIEAKYSCNAFKILYIEEGSSLGAYMLANPSGSFNAYLSPTPFVWFNKERQSASAASFFAYYSGLTHKNAPAALEKGEGELEEFFLKTGKKSWAKQ